MTDSSSNNNNNSNGSNQEPKRRWRLVGRTRTGQKIYVGTRTEAGRIFARKQRGLYPKTAFTPKS